MIEPKYVVIENVKGLVTHKSTLDKEAGISDLVDSIELFNSQNLQSLTPVKNYALFINNLSFYNTRYLGENSIIDEFIQKDFVQTKLKEGVSKFEGGTLNIIINTFSKLGYNMEWRVFNSKDFGIPQSRERIYIVAHKRGTETRPFLAGIGTHRPPADFRKNKQIEKKSNSIIDVIAVSNPAFKNRKLNGRIFKEPEEPMFTITRVGNHGLLYVSKDAFVGGQKGEYSDSLHKIFKLSESNNREGLYYACRKFSALEAFKIMGYEEEHYLRAKKVNSEAKLHMQAGNSITPQIAYNIGLNLT